MALELKLSLRSFEVLESYEEATDQINNTGATLQLFSFSIR